MHTVGFAYRSEVHQIDVNSKRLIGRQCIQKLCFVCVLGGGEGGGGEGVGVQ